MAIKITANSESTEVRPRGTTFSVDELQGVVQGYFEIIRANSGKVMVVNEEGLIRGLPLNALASTLASRPIVGNVLLCTMDELDDEFTPARES